MSIKKIGHYDGWLTVVAADDTHWRLIDVTEEYLFFLSWSIKHPLRSLGITMSNIELPNMRGANSSAIPTIRAVKLIKRYYWMFTDPLSWVKINASDERWIRIPRRRTWS